LAPIISERAVLHVGALYARATAGGQGQVVQIIWAYRTPRKYRCADIYSEPLVTEFIVHSDRRGVIDMRQTVTYARRYSEVFDNS
jgi:hypothetical protein